MCSVLMPVWAVPAPTSQCLGLFLPFLDQLHPFAADTWYCNQAVMTGTSILRVSRPW